MKRLFWLGALAMLGCGEPDPTGTTGTGNGAVVGAPTGLGGGTTSGATSGLPGSGTTQTFPIPEGWIRVDLDGGAAQASVDAAIGDDGTLYVSWVDENGSDADALVARSTDGGATWSTPVRVDGPGRVPLVAAGRQPYLHAGTDALWVVFTRDTSVHLFRSDLDPIAFTEVPLDEGAVTFVDYAKVATDASGQAWVTWIAYNSSTHWPAVAREADGFTVREAGAFAELPCECCRNDLFFTDSGTAILAYRGNDGSNRDIWSVRGSPSDNGFATSVQVSHTGWASQVCPMQGPRLAQLGDGTLLVAWTDPTAGPWQAWTARSSDDGLSWSGDTRAATFLAGDQRDPDLAADGTDVWMTIQSDWSYHLLESTDGGVSFSQLEALDSGATNIEEPQVEARGGIALVAGANAAGEVVLQRLK